MIVVLMVLFLRYSRVNVQKATYSSTKVLVGTLIFTKKNEKPLMHIGTVGSMSIE